MPGALGVWLGGGRVGTLTNLPGDYNLFSFEEDYLEDPHPLVLSQSFIGESGNSIRIIPRVHRVSPPFFANLLPEEDALLRGIVAKQQDINRSRDYPFLSALGRDLPGAVVIRELEPTTESEEEPEVPLSTERPLRFSLAGVQLKFSASLVANRLAIPLEGIGGHWIVKLPTNAFSRLPENEYTIMQLAALTGLGVPEIRLIDLDEVEGLPGYLPALRPDEPRKAYVIRRFDRAPDGVRSHYEDFNQIAGQAPRDKYDNKATHWLASVIATLCPSEDLDEFLRRLVFGICVGNNDMHLKNWALAYPDGRRARIAPMYDFVCTRLYFPDGDLALTVGGKRRFEEIDEDALRTFAASAEISSRHVLALVRETAERLREGWRTVRDGVSDRSLVEAVERNFRQTPLMNAR